MVWKFYFWVLTLLLGASTGLLIADSLGVLFPAGTPLLEESWTWIDSLSILITWVGIVGLFGLAYKKVIGEQGFWKQWFVFILIFDISYEVYERYPEGFVVEELWLDILACSLGIPFYLALYFYGYKSDELWNSEPNPPN